jgi:PAS domain S-box-containing protein
MTPAEVALHHSEESYQALVESVRALEESRKRLKAVFENATDAILLVGDDGRYVDANPAAIDLLGYSRDELLALRAVDLIPPGAEGQAHAARQAFHEDGRYSGTYRLRRKNGDVREAEFRSVANILPGLHLAIVRDVTEARAAQAELRRTAERLQEAEAVAHVGSWEWNLASGELMWSDEHYRIFGLSPRVGPIQYDEAIQLVHPDDRSLIDAMVRQVAVEDGDYAMDARLIHPDGEERTIHSRGHAVKNADGEVERVIGIAHDITERTRDHDARRALLRRLFTIGEEERSRLSRELHDGIGQALTALLVGLRTLEEASSMSEARLLAARHRALVAQTIDDVGRLARGLRPAALDDLGLGPALERHARDQAWLFGVHVDVDAGGSGQARLPAEVETALYRTAQEALANAAQHGKPSVVRVSVKRTPAAVHLTVADDGAGFDVPGAAASDGLGLHTMRERAELLGGRFEIHSSRGAGTQVRVVIPLAT